MGQVAVTLNGRAYNLRCGDGEDERLMALAADVRRRFDKLVAQFGQAGDDRLLLMTALLIADDLADARERIAELERDLEDATAPVGEKVDRSTPRSNSEVTKAGANSA